MKPFPISIQLYSVREAMAKDFTGVLKQIAAMGYVGVEFAGLHGKTPKEARALIDDLGLAVSSTHGPMPTPENVNEIIDTAKILGYTRHISGFGPPQFETKEKALEAAAIVEKAAALLKGTGITLGVHNHWWEFDKSFDGLYPYDVFMKAAPSAFGELDTYWVTVGGADPVAVIKKYGKRLPLLHIKDGPANKELAMTAVGGGKLDWPSIIGAAPATLEWLVVELDRCDTDMIEAVAQSYRYLTSKGLAKGRK